MCCIFMVALLNYVEKKALHPFIRGTGSCVFPPFTGIFHTTNPKRPVASGNFLLSCVNRIDRKQGKASHDDKRKRFQWSCHNPARLDEKMRPQRFSLLLQLSCLAIAFGKIYNEGDHLLPGFDVQSLEVAREYRRKNPECPEVMEKVTEYR